MPNTSLIATLTFPLNQLRLIVSASLAHMMTFIPGLKRRLRRQRGFLSCLIKIIQTKQFSKIIDDFLKKRQLLLNDFVDFQRKLTEYPEAGDIVIGTGGVRKIRLKSASGGKSGGFRVCYYFLTQHGKLFLLLIYAKNKQEDLTIQEKKDLKELVGILKGTMQ
jgi:hypothetical protein